MTRLDITLNFIEKWTISFLVLTAYYFFSFNIIRNAYQMTHLPDDERLVCGMPLLGCSIGQFILAGLALAILFIRMFIRKDFAKKYYWLTVILILPPLLVVNYLIYS